jgi:hypothetical protein
MKTWYQKNKVRLSKKSHDKYVNNKQDIIKRNHDYYWNNKDDILKKKAEYLEKNRDDINKKKREARSIKKEGKILLSYFFDSESDDNDNSK